MGSVADTQATDEKAAEPAPQRRIEGPVATPAVGGPERVLALQRQIGNAGVARLVARQTAEAAKPAAAPVVTKPARAERKLARGFWGSLWKGVKKVGSAIGSGVKTAAVAVGGAVKTAAVAVGGAVKDAAVAVGGATKDAAVAVGGAVKDAAVAVGGAVKDAASWIWDGAKAVGQWAVDWLSKAGAAVWEAIKWFGSGAWEVIKAVGTWLFEKLALAGSLAWDFIRFLPLRIWHVVIQGWDLIAGIVRWLVEGFRGGFSWAWVLDGLKRALNWTIETVIRFIELFGIADALQFIWGMAFRTRTLKKEERDASELVHGPYLIPYWQIRVDEGSYMVKLGKAINKLFDPNAQERALTTMHLVQAPKGIDLETMVHELTHCVQYDGIGAVYMPQALHGQASTEKYDYGNLTTARAAGRHYEDFNREQQAQMAEDYYVVKTTGRPGRYGATEPELYPYIMEMRRKEF